MKKFRRIISVLCVIALLMGMAAVAAVAAPEDYQYYSKVKFVTNKNGLVLGYYEGSGVKVILDEESGYYFKDLNKNDKIDPYEDWRLPSKTRAENLVSLMTLDKKLALKSHGGINANSGLRFTVSRSSGKSAMAETNNRLQSQCEATEWGIPCVQSSDPRHTGIIDSGFAETDELSGSTISQWPNTLAMGNSFSEELFKEFGETIASEYRAAGIQMQLGPQFDQVTDPRWSRNTSCITEDYLLNADLARAMIRGMQNTRLDPIEDYGVDPGWGPDSVAAMSKHYPSSGTGEFGYEGHADVGKFNVFPGGGFEDMLTSFHDASGFYPWLNNTADQASAAMPCYSILVDGAPTAYDKTPVGVYGGGSFSEWLIKDILRGEYEYEGMLCTDWGIYGSRGWGIENYKGFTEPYRLLRSYLIGIDQAGGYSNLNNITAAYNMGVNGNEDLGVPAYGEEFMNNLVDESCVRILRLMFNLGIFENPYCDPDFAEANNGSVALNEKALQAHLESIVMLKNADKVLPIVKEGAKAYLPQLATVNARTGETTYSYPLNPNAVSKFFDVAESPEDADFAIVQLNGPKNGNGTKGTAQTAQFLPYTAEYARPVSIGGDWLHADGSYLQRGETPNPKAGDYKENRTVNGMKNNGAPNYIDMLWDTYAEMDGKPIIVILNYSQGMVPAEFEPLADVILAGSSTAPGAYLSVISGAYNPTGLLAISLPESMKAVEQAYEDIPHDMINYVDSEGNEYEFGFGLNYEGRIIDERTDYYTGLSPNPYEITFAPEEVETGELFYVTVKVPSSVTGFKLVNEKGAKIGIKDLYVYNDNNSTYWYIGTSIGSPGDRQIKILTKEFGKDYEDNGLDLNLTVTRPEASTGAQAKVKSFEFDKYTIGANVPVGTTIKTNALAETVKIYNEKESSMGKKLISRSSDGNTITWKYEISIGTKGMRAFTAAAAKGDGIMNFNDTCSAVIEVY